MKEASERSVALTSRYDDAEPWTNLDPWRLFSGRSERPVHPIEPHAGALCDAQSRDLAGQNTVALRAFAQQPIGMERWKQVAWTGDDKTVWRMRDVDHARLLPVAMCECVRDELSDDVRLEVDEPDLGSTDSKGVGLGDPCQPREDILDQQHQGPSSRVLSAKQDGAFAAGTWRRREDCAPVGDQGRERSLATVQQDRSSADTPSVQQLARAEELLAIFVCLTGQLVLADVSQPIRSSSQRRV
jgi:hypothetical protein